MKFIIWLEICYEALQVVLQALGLELLEEEDAEGSPVKRARDEAQAYKIFGVLDVFEDDGYGIGGESFEGDDAETIYGTLIRSHQKYLFLI